MEWMLLPLKRYADFQGRSRRLEYWMFTLGMTIVALVLAGLAFATGGFDPNSGLPSGIWLAIFGLFWLAIIVPSIAVAIRRLHDQDKSGWFYLLAFIPYVGGLILFVLMLLPGTPGQNRFGPDPKDPSGEGLEHVFS